MNRRSFLISCSALTLATLTSACATTTSTPPTATPSPALLTPTPTHPATSQPTPAATTPSLPPTPIATPPASPASTATGASIPPPTPPIIDPAFTQKLAAIPPEDLQWRIRNAPIGPDEVPSNLTDPGIGGADIFTTSGPLLALLFIGFRENTHRAFYNIYHNADLAQQSYTGVTDLYQHTPGTVTRVPPGFPFPTLLAASATATECLILVGPIMIDARAGIDQPTTPAFQTDAIALASAALAHLQRIILNPPAQPLSTPKP